MIRLPPDFREFLSLLNSHRVEYLLIGGYAVAYHGYPRPTGDMDVWIAVNSENARRVAQARTSRRPRAARPGHRVHMNERLVVGDPWLEDLREPPDVHGQAVGVPDDRLHARGGLPVR